MSFHNRFDRPEEHAGRDLTQDYAQPGTGPRLNQHPAMPAPYRGGGADGPTPGAGFAQAIKLFYRKYAQFSGRASRSEYWWVCLFFAAVSMVLTLLLITAGGNILTGEMNAFGVLLMGLLGLFFLGSLLPSIAITVRRLHDANYSGWLYLINLVPLTVGFIPVLGQLVSFAASITMLVLALQPSRPEGARFDR